VKSRDFFPDPRTGVKISAFPAPLEDRKLTLSLGELLNQRRIVATGTPALALASAAAPISRSDPRVIIGSMPGITMRASDTERALHGTLRWPCGARRSMDWDGLFSATSGYFHATMLVTRAGDCRRCALPHPAHHRISLLQHLAWRATASVSRHGKTGPAVNRAAPPTRSRNRAPAKSLDQMPDWFPRLQGAGSDCQHS
jgi:hypothetical protein